MLRCIHWIPAAIASRPRPLATPLRVIHDRVEPSSRRLSDVIHAKKNQIEPPRANAARLQKGGELPAEFFDDALQILRITDGLSRKSQWRSK
jgi:hypothetical protein